MNAAWLGYGVMVVGVFFTAVAAIGVVRLPDVFCRSHAVAKGLTLGLILLLVGMGLVLDGGFWTWVKIVAAIAFQFVTVPVASHLFCLIGYRKGVQRWQPPARLEK